MGSLHSLPALARMMVYRQNEPGKTAMSGSFIVYLIGYIIAIIGVGYGLYAAGVPEEWIIATTLILIGLGIVYALSRSQRDRAVREPREHSPTTPREHPE